MTTIRPRGDYRPAIVIGDTVVSAGITPRSDTGELLAVSAVGHGGLSVDHATNLAAVAAQRALDACTEALPTEASITAPLALTVFIRSVEMFTEHSTVADGACRTLRGHLSGRMPVRAAVGVSSLPGGAPLELQLMCAWTVDRL